MIDTKITDFRQQKSEQMLEEGYRVQAVVPIGSTATNGGYIIWERCPPPTLITSNLSGIPDKLHIPPLTAAERVQPAQATQAPPTQQKAPSGPETAKFDAWMGTSNLRGPSTGEYVQLRNAFLNAYEMPNIDPEDLLRKFRAAFPEVAQMMQDRLGKYVPEATDQLVRNAIETHMANARMLSSDRADLTELRNALDSDSYLVLTKLAPGEAP